MSEQNLMVSPEKLCAAIRAQLAAWGKAMEGTA